VLPSAATAVSTPPTSPSAAAPKSSLKRRKSVTVRKKKKRAADDSESPIKRQLAETSTWTRPEMDLFANLPTSSERVRLVYDILPDDATGLDRLWPIAIVQKDSKLRRTLRYALMPFTFEISVNPSPK
jgi:hypothetical protein